MFGRDHEQVDGFVTKAIAQSNEASLASSTIVVTGLAIAADGFPPLATGTACRLDFAQDEVVIRLGATESISEVVATVPLGALRLLRVGGRGAITSQRGGGWFGGGFGVEGMIEGVALATALNALTSRSNTRVETILHLNAGARELMITTSEMTPEVLQARLAPVFMRVKEMQSALSGAQPSSPPAAVSVADELSKLAQLHDTGVLSNAEFATAKARLLGM